MIEICFVLVLLGVSAYVASRIVGCAAKARPPVARFDWERRQRQERENRRRAAAWAEQRRRRQHAALNLKARQLQQAILALSVTPDFRRAAAFAANAKDVPLAFRQRVFRRFRARLVQHMMNRLGAGSDPDALLTSLTVLVQHLGVAPFEADYIRQDAERHRRTAAQVRPHGYSHELRAIQREHDERMRSLRSLAGLDPDTREQLLEAEEMRFRELLLQVGSQTTPRGGPAV